MDNIFRLLRRNSKQILSFMLAFVVFVENPLTALASPTTNESFNISKPVLVDDSPENFDPDTYTGEPFYFDENGNRVYDSENEELQESRRQLADQLNLENIEFEPEQPDYSDIEWTFEDYPLTTMGDPEISSYIVGIDDAAYIVIGTCMAAYGVYAGIKTIKKFASNTLEPWIRRKYGNNETKMKTWQDCLATKAGTTYVGMKVLSSMVGECLGSATWKGNEATFESSYMTDTTYAWFPASMKDRYIKSATWKAYDSDGKLLYQTQADIIGNYPVGSYKKTAYVKYQGSTANTDFSMLQGILDNENKVHVESGTSFCVRYYYNRFYYDEDGETGYYQWTESFPFERKFPAFVALNLGLVFANQDALRSYLLYDTTGGLYTVDGVTSPTETIQVKKTWIGLQENFSKNYTVSDSITVPSTAEASDKLLSSIYASNNESEVISNIAPYWKIDKIGSSLSTVQAYSHLSYLLSAIATYAGTSVAQSQIDSFISEYYGNYVDGTSARKEEQSQDILAKFVVIQGGNNGSPDDNNKDKNKYKISKKLAEAFGVFLFGAGLISSALDFNNGTAISPTIEVVSASTIQPNPSPNPGGSSSSGIDSSKLTELLNKIIKSITALPDSITESLSEPINNISRLIELLPDKLVHGFISSDFLTGISSLVGSLPNAIADLMPGVLSTSLPNILQGVFGLTNGFSLPSVLSSIEAALASFPDALIHPLKSIESAIDSLPDRFRDIIDGNKTQNDNNETENDSGFTNFLNLFMIVLFIIVMLLILFINCLRFIVLVFNIPAFDGLLDENILRGINYLKEVNLPLLGDNLSLYNLLLSCAYFVIFLSVIAVIRKKIDKIHI
ncbi:hypothetical protein [Clostridium sp. AM28-20LB]|mgnify:FL=1|uniref:hypothetical protein n=1 Tax=Clostridium sp. AM28-20LB TaxID=2293027 RepID=UPI000E4C978D|nr:hypothetical protein [Clostridium sp. AM28-20LB]RHT75909.1 hypothetical protein DW739_07870 [Clostridium sp. AM28-20LB]